MIRPASEIEYPPSEALRMKAAMIARMEALQKSSSDFMAVIAARVGAEEAARKQEIQRHAIEQEQLMLNMRRVLED